MPIPSDGLFRALQAILERHFLRDSEKFLEKVGRMGLKSKTGTKPACLKYFFCLSTSGSHVTKLTRVTF